MVSTINATRVLLRNEIPERTTPKLTATLRDQDGAPVAAASLDALSLTLFNDKTKAIVNGRNHSDVLNAGIGTINAQGVLTLAFTALDTAILDATLATELRVALIEWDWTVSSVPKSGKHEISFVVRNLHHVASSPPCTTRRSMLGPPTSDGASVRLSRSTSCGAATADG
jgi:hypothetical protein